MPHHTGAATVGADGKATVTVRTRSSERWIVRQVSTEMASAPAGATCALKLNGYQITPLVATGTPAGGDPPVEINPGDELTVEWAAATAGLTGKVLIIYDRLRG